MQRAQYRFLKNSQDKSRYLFFLISICMTSLSILVLHCVRGNICNPAFSDGKDAYMDFFNHLVYVENPKEVYWASRHACFPPLVYLLYLFLNRMLPEGAIMMYNSDVPPNAMLLYVVYVVCIAILVYSAIIAYAKPKNTTEKFCLVIAIILSNIFIYGVLERGNSASLVLILLLYALLFKDSESIVKREFALIFIAVAAGIKVYPAVFGLLYLREKRWKEALRLILYGIIFFFGPFIFFGGIEGVKQFFTLQADIHTSEQSSMFYSFISLVSYITKLPVEANRTKIWSMILSAALLTGFFALPLKKWQQHLFLCAAMVLIPFWSGYYTMIYIAIPCLTLFRESNEDDEKQCLPIRYCAFLLFSVIFSLKLFMELRSDTEIRSRAVEYIALYALLALSVIDGAIAILKKKAQKEKRLHSECSSEEYRKNVWCKAIFWAILSVFCLTGLLRLNDYGTPWDEYEEITIFIGNIKEYVRLFFGAESSFNIITASIDYARDNANIDHGSSLYYVLAPFSHWFMTGRQYQFVLLWRTEIILIFALGGVFLYHIVKHYTQNRAYGILAMVMLFVSPRFFAESIYNHKDLAQLTLWLGMLWFCLLWLRDRQYRWAILTGVVAGFAINMRFASAMCYFVCGVVYCGTILYERRNYLKGALQGVLSIAAFLFVLFLTTPGSWDGLIEYFEYCLSKSAAFPWGGSVLFNGDIIKGTQLPWYYLPYMIAITTPILFGIFSIYGNISACFGVSREEKTKKIKLYSKINPDILLLLGITYLPLLTYLIMKPVLYNGWRHYYFLYGMILIWAVLGFYHLIHKNKKVLTRVVAGLMVLQLLGLCVLLGVTHPHQYTYYNLLGGIRPGKYYEMDYWGVSGKNAMISFIDSEYQGIPLRICGVEHYSNNLLPQNHLVLPDEYMSKIQIVTNPEEAEYLFVNHSYVNENVNTDLYNEIVKNKKVAQTTYLGEDLTVIYKRDN